MQSALHSHVAASPGPTLGKRSPGPLHLPAKRLKASQGDCANIKPLSSPLNIHLPTRRPSDDTARNTSLLSPQVQSVGPSPMRPNSMRGDPLGRFKAEKWFEDTNKNASGMKNVPFNDDDPPFYIHHELSSGGNSTGAVRSDGPFSHDQVHGPSTGPTKSLLAKMDISSSNSEDFRSVIDDLTVQNQKLKKKLKKYEKLHCSHLQEEKLFEVRIHGLAAHRKRDLEETLRNFASSVEAEIPETPAQIIPLQSLTPADPLGTQHKPPSSSTSASKQLDSAYASMSGKTGGSHPQLHDQHSEDRTGQATQAKQQIRSYLHDMPESLMPKHTIGMSDRSKSKLVVKRLEQIFTGKGAASRRHKQSHQQQEVSHSAARDDRQEARGRRPTREGMREARILSSDAELPVETMSETNLASHKSRRSSNDGDDSARDTNASRDVSPEQRPTRPLDLDLHRAQVPSDNIEYIRHLGLAPPAKDPNEVSEDNGWVYLNLLISMAQLHTLNVTPEFIRHAIADVSAKFELSADGTKIRWRGGTDGTRMSSDSDGSEDVTKSKSTETSLSVSKRGSFADLSEAQNPHTGRMSVPPESSAASEIGAKRRPVPLGQVQDGGKFQYKPLFFHTAPSEENDDSSRTTEESSSSWRGNGTGRNSGLNSGSHGIRESEARLRKQNLGNGPIIFYNKARFCTDLSGDRGSATIDADAYRRYTEHPIGCSSLSTCDDEDERTDKSLLCSRDSMEVATDGHTTTRSALDLEDLKSCISDCEGSPSPMDMEASGLGGIQPEDNFVVRVQVRHGNKSNKQAPRKLSPFSTPRGPIRRMLHRLPERNLDTFREETKEIPRSQPLPLKMEIISAIKRNLPPSRLPGPSYKLSTTDDDDDDEEEEYETSSGNENGLPAPPRRSVDEPVSSRPADFFIGSPSSETKESSYFSTVSGSDDDSSIDLLAQARLLDPDLVAAQEREFESNSSPPSVRPMPASWATSIAAAAGSYPRGNVAKAQSDVDSMSVDANAD